MAGSSPNVKDPISTFYLLLALSILLLAKSDVGHESIHASNSIHDPPLLLLPWPLLLLLLEELSHQKHSKAGLHNSLLLLNTPHPIMEEVCTAPCSSGSAAYDVTPA